MAAIAAFAAMLPVALLAVRHRPAWVGIVTSVPVLLLSIPTLVTLLSRRLEWVLVGAPGLPPLRMAGEGTPFGSVAVPPFVIIPAWALAGLIEPAWLRRWVRIALVAVGIPMTILSGSRSAWLAIAAAAVIAAAPFAWRHRRRLRPSSRPTWRAVPRRHRCAGGRGPGRRARPATRRRDHLAALPVRALARHAGRLADRSAPRHRAGVHALRATGRGGRLHVPGAPAALAQPAARRAGRRRPARPRSPRRCSWRRSSSWPARGAAARRSGARRASFSSAWASADCSTTSPSSRASTSSRSSLVAVALLDAGAVDWVRPSVRPSVRWVPLAIAGAGAGAVLLAAMVTADAAGIAYRTGIRSAVDGDWGESTRWLTRAVEIDPWHPAGPAALAVAAEAAGEPDVARRAAEAATALNPGDASAWTNLSLLCGGAGDRSCEVHAAERAAAMARYGPAELLNAAVILEAEGEHEEADRAYRLSLLSQVRTSFVVDWPRDGAHRRRRHPRLRRCRVGAPAPRGAARRRRADRAHRVRRPRRPRAGPRDARRGRRRRRITSPPRSSPHRIGRRRGTSRSSCATRGVSRSTTR